MTYLITLPPPGAKPQQPLYTHTHTRKVMPSGQSYKYCCRIWLNQQDFRQRENKEKSNLTKSDFPCKHKLNIRGEDPFKIKKECRPQVHFKIREAPEAVRGNSGEQSAQLTQGASPAPSW